MNKTKSQVTDKSPYQLPVLPLRNVVIFPGVPSQILIGRKSSLNLVADVLAGKKRLFAVLQTDAGEENPDWGRLHEMGVVVEIERAFKLPDGNMQLVLRGLQRVHMDELIQEDPYIIARGTSVDDELVDSREEQALAYNLSQQFQKMVGLVPKLSEELQVRAINLEKDPGHLADFIASGLDISLSKKQELLAQKSVVARLRRLTWLLNRELSILEMSNQIQGQIEEEMGQAQRESYLREQMRVIQQELGDGDEDLDRLRNRLKRAKLPDEVRLEAQREFDRLSHMTESAAEYSVARTYLECLLDMPWYKKSIERVDLERSRHVLDADHEGLERVKERVLEFLSVRTLKKSSKSPIFCFVGPPGVGKTSLGRSIARAMGRKFVHFSLGGVRDESEIRGHRRTYIGALPGRIIQSLRKVGTKNPVFMLDELDKIGSDFRGDPAAALLEVLDPEQNDRFRDHYLDVPFDLSDVTFVATANQLDTIPPALRDRLEVIQLFGYTEDEKVHIVQNHIISRQLREHGLARRKVSVEEPVIRQLIRGYTQEAGVRNLNREVGRLCRKIAREVVRGQRGPFNVTEESLGRYLGSVVVRESATEELGMPGLVAGLAWTPVGGEVMYVEATQMRGGKGLTLTGQLGDVMRESAQIALSYIRTHAAKWKIEDDFFDTHDIHIHLPAGAIPKDGPSAGVAVTTALLSLFTRRCVRDDVAMTGEITLRGRVLPVGGVKEKVLAAHRSGLKRVILPRANERDLEEIPSKVRRKMDIVLVGELDEVFAACIEGKEIRRAAA